MEDRSLRVRVTGPPEPFADGFRADLVASGYTALSTKHQLHLVAHMSRWLASQGLEAGQLVPERAEQFTGLRSLLHYLHLDGRTARQLASVVPAVPG